MEDKPLLAWLASAAPMALIVYLFGVRSYLAWRSTGDTGLRLHAGPAGTARWWAKLLFIAALALLVAGPIAHLSGLAAAVPPTGFRPGGAVVTLLGGGLVVVAQHGMGSSWRIGVAPGETTDLVTDGLFAVVRNPVFTGLATFAAGTALLAPGLLSAVAVLAVLAAVQVQVRLVEEPYLLRTHGDAYRGYAAATGRFLPAVGRLVDTR